MAGTDAREVIARSRPEGTIPLISIDGTAYDCGRQYGEIVLKRYPDYRVYLDQAQQWLSLSGDAKRLIEERVPHMLDLYRGLYDAAGAPNGSPGTPTVESCTSFGVHGSVTLDGGPISGQTKDTIVDSIDLYIVLRMHIKDAPAILVLAYPGEVLGYGMWSTGMSIFRNTLHSSAGGESGLTMVQYGIVALAGESVEQAVEVAKEYGLADSGNFLVSDGVGRSVAVEFNAGGVSVIEAKNGIAAHANHPVGKNTAPFERFPDEDRRQDSCLRMRQITQLLNAERGRLTAPKAMMLLADHSHYPGGICRHTIANMPGYCTTAAVVAEPTLGRLHVTRGNPCSNWPTTYTL